MDKLYAQEMASALKKLIDSFSLSGIFAICALIPSIYCGVITISPPHQSQYYASFQEHFATNLVLTSTQWCEKLLHRNIF